MSFASTASLPRQVLGHLAVVGALAGSAFASLAGAEVMASEPGRESTDGAKSDTVYGAAIGATLFVVAQNYLQDLLKIGQGALEGVPLLSAVVNPDRWLLWLGVLFVLSVYYFPAGIVGRLRAITRRP